MGSWKFINFADDTGDLQGLKNSQIWSLMKFTGVQSWIIIWK